ncbi:MAG: hypothetical protein JO339_35535 [Alphaproteobacteria bacterium]|nr:hypothetical protein [Alphaproteobacteria bacterium]
MEQSWRNALLSMPTRMTLIAGLLCLIIVLAQASAAALAPPAVGAALAGPAVGLVLASWRPIDGEADDDEAINAASAPDPDAWDGVYGGTATAREGGVAAVFRITVRDGVGTGTDSRLDCGTAPVSLRISPAGDVSGVATVFGLTCIKTDVALRGRAVGGALRLRLGTQYLELARP